MTVVECIHFHPKWGGAVTGRHTMKSMKFGYLKNIKNILYIEAFIIMGTMFGLLLYMAPLMVCCYL